MWTQLKMIILMGLMMENESLIEKAIRRGSDNEYQKWVRLWPSCLSGAYSEVVEGVGKCEFAHVRRASNSGTAYKPEYSGIPLTHDEHALQHQKGESVFCPPEWYEAQAQKYLTMWINGVMPPEMEEQKRNWKKEYILEHAGQILAIWLLLQKYYKNKNNPPIKMTIQRASKRRSNKQNSAQWGVIYDSVMEYYNQHPNHLAKDFLKSIQLGVDKDSVHAMFKRLFNKGKSTARFSTIEATDYFNRIREYFFEEYDYLISEIEES